MEEKRRLGLGTLWTVLRFFIGAGLIAFLLIKLDVGRIFQYIKNMDIRYLILALIPYLLFIIFSTWRWQVLLDYKKMEIPFKSALVIYFIAFFFNNLLPTTIGGDVMRVLLSMKNRKAEALAIVLADRILGFIGLFCFGLLSVIYLSLFQNRSEFLSLMIIGLSLLIFITFLLFSKRVYSIFSPAVGRIKILRIGERINNLHNTMTDFGSAWGVIIICIIQSIIIQALLSISPYLVLKSMGKFDVSILPFFIYLPIINVISMIPVSFNALGIRENAYVILFQRAGLSGEVSMTISLVSFFIFFLLSLIGGIFFIFYKKSFSSQASNESFNKGGL
ncbi:MAG: lysylphosphatidylglycerol synthase transmembrane domain-containing protein [candidate division WOR-3 bacterium]